MNIKRKKLLFLISAILLCIAHMVITAPLTGRTDMASFALVWFYPVCLLFYVAKIFIINKYTHYLEILGDILLIGCCITFIFVMIPSRETITLGTATLFDPDTAIVRIIFCGAYLLSTVAIRIFTKLKH